MNNSYYIMNIRSILKQLHGEIKNGGYIGPKSQAISGREKIQAFGDWLDYQDELWKTILEANMHLEGVVTVNRDSSYGMPTTLPNTGSSLGNTNFIKSLLSMIRKDLERLEVGEEARKRLKVGIAYCDLIKSAIKSIKKMEDDEIDYNEVEKKIREDIPEGISLNTDETTED